jgi:hypothetical protein
LCIGKDTIKLGFIKEENEHKLLTFLTKAVPWCFICKRYLSYKSLFHNICEGFSAWDTLQTAYSNYSHVLLCPDYYKCRQDGQFQYH